MTYILPFSGLLVVLFVWLSFRADLLMEIDFGKGLALPLFAGMLLVSL